MDKWFLQGPEWKSQLARPYGYLQSSTHPPVFYSHVRKYPVYSPMRRDSRTKNEFVALRAVLRVQFKGAGKITSKVIWRHVVKNYMTLENHERFLFGDPELNQFTNTVSIGFYNYQISTIINKILHITVTTINVMYSKIKYYQL